MGDWASEAKRRHEFGPLDGWIGTGPDPMSKHARHIFPGKGRLVWVRIMNVVAVGAVTEMEMQIGNFARECNLSAPPIAPGDAS